MLGELLDAISNPDVGGEGGQQVIIESRGQNSFISNSHRQLPLERVEASWISPVYDLGVKTIHRYPYTYDCSY